MLSYRKLAMRVLGRPLHTGGGGGGIGSPRPASQRAAALVLTAAMLTTFTAPAFAKTWYIEDGDITISASETKGTNKVSQGAEPEVEDTGTIITNREKDASSHTVTINAGNDKVEVTLDNVNIKADSGSALISKGDVTLTLKGDNHLTGGNGGNGIYSSSGVAISGGAVTANGGDSKDGSGGNGIYSSGGVTISSGSTVTANGGDGEDGSGGRGITSNGGVTVSGGTVNAKGGSGKNGNGGDGIRSFNPVAISGGTVTATAGSSSGSYGRDGITTSSSLTISGGTVTANGGSGSYRGGSGIHSRSDIDLSGSLELTAKAGSPNGKALSQNGIELDPNTFKEKLDPGANIITKDADGKVINQVSIPRPVEPEGPVIPEESSSSSDSGSSTPSADGGSATPSAPASPLPGLTVTDKDGQRISYTSIRGNNVLSIRAGRFTASLRVSLAALRQLRAEGIDTITFRTVLCSTTLSVDELLAIGGEDTEVVLIHHIRSSTLTVGGKAV